MIKTLRKRVLPLIFIPAAGFLAVSSILNTGGPGGGYTNAPGEANCTSCHSGTLNQTPANLANLTLSAGFTANGYIPDSIYTVTVSYSQAGINKFGFQITSLRTDNDAFVGTFTAGTGNSKVTANISGSSREYIQHNSGGTSGSGSRSWTFTWRAPSTNVDTITFYAVVNATNSNSSTSGDQIYAKEFKIPVSNVLPTAIRAVSKTTVCAGDTVTYYGSGTNNPTSYRWRFQVGSPAIVTTQNVIRTYNFPGTFWDTLWVTNAKGQSEPIGNSITVISGATANITAISPNDTACVGDSITLSANTGAGLKYLWNTGNPADTLSTLKVGQDGSYAVTVTNASGCSKQSTPANIIFFAPPAPVLVASTAADTLCEGDSFSVSVNGSGISTYAFYDQGVLKQSGSSNTYTTSDLGNHSIRVEAGNGFCTVLSADSIVKHIAPRLSAPVINCTSNTDTIFYTWSEPQFSYEVSEDNGQNWIPSGGSTSHRIGGIGFSTSRTLWVRKIGSGVCSVGKIGTATCTTAPCSNINYILNTNKDTLCLGDTVLLSVDNLAAGNYTFAFNGGAAGSDNTFEFVPQSAADDSIMISITDLNAPSCPPLVAYKRVVVEDIPVPQVIYDDTVFCSNIPVYANIQGYNSAFNYTLYIQGGAPLFSKFPLDSNKQRLWLKSLIGQQNLIVSSKFGTCYRETPIQTVIGHLPPASQIKLEANGNSIYFADSTTSYARTWNFGDNTPEDTNRYVTHVYQKKGTYTVRLIASSAEGCLDTSFVNVDAPINVSTGEFKASQIKIFPNPAAQEVRVESDLAIQQIIIRDLSGRIVHRLTELESTSIRMPLNEYAPGVYLIQVELASGSSEILKLLIER